MFLTKLALKNMLRHRNRTVITGLVIAAAVFFYIFLDSMIAGMVDMSYDILIDYEVGHLQVVNKAYWDEEEKLPLENLFSVGRISPDIWESLAGYRAASSELAFPARLNDGEHELPVVGKGIIPEDFLKVFSFEGHFVGGEMFSKGEHRAVMGQRLADLFELEVGDYITLLVRDKNGSFNTIEAEIAGLVHTIDPNVNSNLVYVPLELAQKALDVPDLVSKIIITLEDRSAAGRLAPILEDRLQDEDLAVYPWNDIDAVSVAGAKNIGNDLLLGLILIIGAMAIINTVILAALERMQEIGMMKAMGLQEKEIVYVFVAESTGIGILGGLMGVLFGAVGVWLFVRYGLDLGVDMDMSSFGIPLIGRMYGAWNREAFVSVFFFAVTVSLLAGIWPAYWAANKDPIQAIQQR
ncbi:MAG: ABC transporter permease [Limnochordia bacterium]